MTASQPGPVRPVPERLHTVTPEVPEHESSLQLP